MHHTTAHTTHGPIRARRLTKRGALGAAALLGIVALFTLGMHAPSAQADAITQCDAIANGGGQGISCTVNVVNNLDLSNPSAPITSSVVTVTTCTGAAGAAEAGVCTTTGPTTSGVLFNTVDQCSYAVDGGGGTLACSVIMVNNIVGSATAVPATVNQCNNSLDSEGITQCNPYPATTDPGTATVVECNDSVNGGGSILDCVVDSTSTVSDALPVTINQCNNSNNGGGSTVTCRVSIATNITPASTGTGGTGGGGTGGTGGSGSSGDTLAFTAATENTSAIVAALLLMIIGASALIFSREHKVKES